MYMTVVTLAGGLPWSGPASLNAVSVMHDIDLEGSNFVASPSLSTPPSLVGPAAGARAAGAAGGVVSSDAAFAAAGVAAGGETDRTRSGAGARSMYLGSDGKFFFNV